MPHAILDHPSYHRLSPYAKTLLFDLGAQYKGTNNGDLCASWSVMQRRGWRSRSTLHRSIQELVEAGFIMQTRQGGRHRCSLYAITWKPIDACDGKLDVAPTRTAPGTWKGGLQGLRAA